MTYTVYGVRIKSIVGARAFAIQLTLRKGDGVRIPIYDGKKSAGYVSSHSGNRYTWTNNHRVYDINMDGTLARGPVEHRSSPGEMRPYTYRRY